MTTLEINPITNGKQTVSSDIQDALSQVGEGKDYDTLELTAGIYLIDGSQKNNPNSILAVNSGSNIVGEAGTILKLMDNAQPTVFKCGLPILGPAGSVGEDIEISSLEFNGNAVNQTTFSKTVCAGTNGKVGTPLGKGFTNFISTYKGAFKSCSFHDIYVHDSCGDGFRSNSFAQSSDLSLYNWRVENCGHCSVMFENTTDAVLMDSKFITRVNGGIRTQNNCSDILFKNVEITATANDYNPGGQITGNDITIKDCKFYDTLGPGVEVTGNGCDDIKIYDCLFVNCGQMPAATQIPGVGGILTNGSNVWINNCIFDGCYGNSVSINIYKGDGVSFTGKGYTVTAKDNIILNTRPALYPGNGSGKHIANLYSSTHTLISENNVFYPKKNYSYGSVTWNDGTPEQDCEMLDGFDIENNL